MKRKKIKIPFTDKVIVDEKFLTERERYINEYNSSVDEVLLLGRGSYIIYENEAFYVVLLEINNIKIPIKSFPFGDDKQYAKLCAEELCEMLNIKM